MHEKPRDERRDELSNRELLFAAQVLDYDFASNIDPTSVHDERRVIYQEALAARTALENKMRQVAISAGLEVDEDVISSWVPNDVQTEALRRALEPQRKRLRMIEGLTAFKEDQAEAAAMQGVPLRAYQQEAVDAFQEFLVHASRTEGGIGKSGIIEMPTGTGKTGIFANIVSQLKYGEEANEPVRVLVLVPTQDILEQTLGRHGERGFGKFTPHLDVGAYYQFEQDLNHEVVVMTNSSFNNLVTKGEMPEFDAVVVDEAHTVVGEQTGERLGEYIKDKVAIGLTATPEYHEEHSAYQLFDHTIYKMKFPDAVHAGRLAPVRGRLIDAKPRIDPFKLSGDPAARHRLERAARREAMFIEAEAIIKRSIERGVGVIVRCPAGDDIELADAFAAHLRNQLVKADDLGMRWINAESVGGSWRRQGDLTRGEKYDLYNRGEIDVLTYVKAIGMGWDSTHAKVLINLAPTTSAVEMRQAIGRIMRLVVDENKNPIEAEVYDFYDPDLGDKQYTCLDALETKNGELLSHRGESDEAPIPVPRRFRREVSPEILGIETTKLGEFALKHKETAVLPDNVEVRVSAEILEGDMVPIDEASRILGISVPTLRGILFSVGSGTRGPVHKEDLETILELHPKLKAGPVPKQGVVSASEFARSFDPPLRLLSLLPFARRQGLLPLRYRDEAGVIGFYFKNTNARALREMIESGEYRIARFTTQRGEE